MEWKDLPQDQAGQAGLTTLPLPPNQEELKWGKAPGRDGSYALFIGTKVLKHEDFCQAPELSREKERCVDAYESQRVGRSVVSDAWRPHRV